MNPKLLWLLRDAPHLYPHKLEVQFPHVMDRIVDAWGTVEMRRYFDSLMMSDRSDRQGFPPEVIMEIFSLSNHYDSANPSRAKMEQEWSDHAQIERMERFQKGDGRK